MSRTISQSIEIKRHQEKIFKDLLHPSAIMEWWGAKIAIVNKKENGIYTVSWGDNIDDPDYITVSWIRKFNFPNGFDLEYDSYYAKTGSLPFKAIMNVQFSISPINEVMCEVKVLQTGIPSEKIADEYYQGCQVGWQQVLKNLKQFCEKEN